MGAQWMKYCRCVTAKSAQTQSVKCTKSSRWCKIWLITVCESIAAAEKRWWRRVWRHDSFLTKQWQKSGRNAALRLMTWSCACVSLVFCLSPTRCMAWCMSWSKVRGHISVLQTKIPTSHPHTRRTVVGMLPCSDQLSRNPSSVQCRHACDYSLDQMKEKSDARWSLFSLF